MINKKSVVVFSMLLLTGFLSTVHAGGKPGLSRQETLGKKLFFDARLSDPSGQSCATCHSPEVGWTGPTSAINSGGSVYEGAVKGRFGNRKPPTVAYGGDSPVLYFDELWIGGMFWDGRATGFTLGDPLAEQALGPFLNPLEQNNANAQTVINKVLTSNYKKLFLEVCTEPDKYYECIGRSIAAYERSSEVTQFTSKYDYWVKGRARLTGLELWGWQLFRGKGKCSACHVEPLFTDFSYDNLGVPRNPANPFYNEPEWNPDGSNWIDPGLGGFLISAGYDQEVYETELGKHKVPTLRNVDKRPEINISRRCGHRHFDTKCKHCKFVKAYGHNGYFKSLEEIVHFYNTRDVEGVYWPEPEVAQNMNTSELGNLKLSRFEELAIVEFMKTLSDGWSNH